MCFAMKVTSVMWTGSSDWHCLLAHFGKMIYCPLHCILVALMFTVLASVCTLFSEYVCSVLGVLLVIEAEILLRNFWGVLCGGIWWLQPRKKPMVLENGRHHSFHTHQSYCDLWPCYFCPTKPTLAILCSRA